MTAYYLAPDVAVLPGPDGTVLFQGQTGRSYKVSALVGEQLATGAIRGGTTIPDPICSQLLGIGVLQRTPARSINDWTPFGAWATLLLASLVSVGAFTWGWLYQSGLLPTVRPQVVGWIMLPLAFVLTTALHEWGHVLALRSMKGRSGRVLLRRGWPWALIEVGPLRQVLPPWRCTMLLVGGILLEFVLLGLSLLGLSVFPNHPLLAALVWVSTVHLAFNLFPTPWSDSGQIVGLIIERLTASKGRGEHARSS